MTKICYVERRFSPASRLMIAQANVIIKEFAEQGYTLTLRQLYYQFVGRAWSENTMRAYKRLGSVVNDARLAGLISWDAIEDRTRFIRKRAHWIDPAHMIESAAYSYSKNLWRGQRKMLEVWIEKDALVSVAEGVCTKWDVPLFSCRGYASQSELWRSAGRHKDYKRPVIVVHLGDHDPSGMDMTRDVENRLHIFGANTTIHRIALNMDQVEHHKLPPNPAKTTDSRYEGYEAEHGDSSWELDAMQPQHIVALIEKKIRAEIDLPMFLERQAEQEEERKLLKKASSNWLALVEKLEDIDDESEVVEEAIEEETEELDTDD